MSELAQHVVANYFGQSIDEYVACTEALCKGSKGQLSALEMNISCPNVKQGGLEFGTDPAIVKELVSACRSVCDLPLWVKLTPNVTDIVPLARAAVEAGADALSICNTLRAIAVDASTARPRIATTFGGLSGPAIKPIAQRLVYEVAQAGLGVPIAGIGGICSGEDAAEFMILGASAVQVGTASFVDPVAVRRIAKELDHFCRKSALASPSALVGTFQPN